MPAERSRPALSGEVTNVETVNVDGTDYKVEVHSFDAVPFNPSPALAAAIAAGNCKVSKRTVEFKVNHPESSNFDADKPSKVYSQELTNVTAVNEEGALTLPAVDGDASKIWEAVSDYSNRNAFQNTYVDMRNAAQGPEKAIEKIQKLLAGLSPAQVEAAKLALGLS